MKTTAKILLTILLMAGVGLIVYGMVDIYQTSHIKHETKQACPVCQCVRWFPDCVSSCKTLGKDMQMCCAHACTRPR